MEYAIATCFITTFEVFTEVSGLFGGRNWSTPCIYPYYGEQCKHQCNCTEELCDHIIGCFQQQGCSAGFYGVNCTAPCRYPSYGELCQQKCNCSEEFCDHIKGCLIYQQQGCSAGFYGVNCTAHCRYPSYGELCQQKCNCSEQFCDNIEGCMINQNQGCSAGFYGVNCIDHCRYPSYGELCQRKCNCSEQFCDHIQGCMMYQQESLTVPGAFNENVNIKKSFMEKHQEDLVIGISISFVLVVICVSFTVKLQIIRKKRAKESRYPSSYVACPLNDIRSSQYFESHFVFRGNNPEAYENLHNSY
ncbi:protein draper-like isoform X3 [Crassostrea angulata]|uniref:protein draper-like isoform X3 n=1 Tax=Magallana angulata TaxID=2784310 RepID=UPI0022B08A4C|nr:protein draper-like isoform X3 [Crassostrea angulata]